ncbi:hypothetical protein MIND_00620700 [Mycena indigotica]|uniref:Uncharacterized protein n=1 Tax=Mycena indigotica TaxID=2126181 RepID=A0A8H6SR68_9AGAR|nr:uncharacterized protein MIND_00620700 [Mycena indigotica]KAF7303904.1 hypothetical protein MIND_00620700 [Mycena indigotica]
MATSSTPGPAIMLFTAFAGLCLIYAFLSPFFKKVRQAAWILTTVASGTMTVLSLPFVFDYVKGGLANVDERAALAGGINRGFQSALFSIALRSLSSQDGHIISYIFGLAAIMELPTFLFGIGTLFPRLRSDSLFAATFFATRICLHMVLIVTYYLPTHRPQDSFVPALILTSVFPLHAMWFLGCIKGCIRRSKERKLARLAVNTRRTVYLDTPGVTLRLRRLRARVGHWVHTRAPVNWVREGRMGRLPAHLHYAPLNTTSTPLFLPTSSHVLAIVSYFGLGGPGIASALLFHPTLPNAGIIMDELGRLVPILEDRWLDFERAVAGAQDAIERGWGGSWSRPQNYTCPTDVYYDLGPSILTRFTLTGHTVWGSEPDNVRWFLPERGNLVVDSVPSPFLEVERLIQNISDEHLPYPARDAPLWRVRPEVRPMVEAVAKMARVRLRQYIEDYA